MLHTCADTHRVVACRKKGEGELLDNKVFVALQLHVWLMGPRFAPVTADTERGNVPATVAQFCATLV